MKEIEKWLARKAQKEAKRPRFDDALLTRRSWNYAFYRLRYMYWRVLLRAALHMVEVSLFAAVFSMDFLAPVLIIRSATAMVISFWWGGLEQLRARVRTHAANNQWPLARKTIDAWLAITVIIGVTLAGGGSAWFVLAPGEYLGFSIFDAYAMAVLIRMALDMLARTYHSGMFALRRIYRPLWSLLIGDILDVAGVLLLWPFLGPWSFAPVLVLVGVLRVGLIFHFVNRAYVTSKIPPRTPGLKVRRAFATLNGNDLVGLFKHGLANSASQIDSLIVLTLAAGTKSEGYLALAILFYVIRPFIGAGYSWARMFYFDFIKLSVRYGGFFAARFERLLKQVALVFAGIMAASAAIWTAVFWVGGGLDWSLSLLVPFFFARSVFGLYQVQAFSYGRYRYLLKTSGVLAVGIIALGLFPQSRLVVILTITVLMILVVTIWKPPQKAATNQSSSDDHRAVSIPGWLGLLAQHPASIRISTAYINTVLGSTHRVITEMVEQAGDRIAVTRFGQNLILWFETKTDDLLSREEVAVMTAGCIRTLTQGTVEKNGAAALNNALSSKLLGNDITQILSNQRVVGLDREKLRREFRSSFPEGKILDSKTGHLSKKEIGQHPFVVQQVLGEIGRVSKGISPNRYKTESLDVTAYCPRGEPELIFVVDREEDLEKRVAWRRLVQSATFVHSTDPESKAIH